MLTQNELAEDTQDLIANLLVRTGSHYSINSQHFGVFYLLSHGIVNLATVLLFIVFAGIDAIVMRPTWSEYRRLRRAPEHKG